MAGLKSFLERTAGSAGVVARWRRVISYLSDAFWFRPALMVVGATVLAPTVVAVEGWIKLPKLVERFVYTGGAAGARGLLGALASSTIGVAGTIFSITIAALSLASGQMGPRLIRNFIRDPGNQIALGAFVATFAYALLVLRTVRGPDEGGFVPHFAVTLGLVFGFACIGVLIWFVHHAASGINADTVIEGVYHELVDHLAAHTKAEPDPVAPPVSEWVDASMVRLDRDGYIQHLDQDGLADWAAENRCAVRLLVRPGEMIYPRSVVAMIKPYVKGAEGALDDALAIGGQQVPAEDLEFAARQLMEVAVRALSPGINDPNTAMTALDRFGSSLCRLAGNHLPSGVVLRDDRPVLIWPATQYRGLLDCVLHPVRQNGASQASVMIRLLEMLANVALVEREAGRLADLRDHADLAHTAALDGCTDRAARDAIEDRRQRFTRTAETGRPI